VPERLDRVVVVTSHTTVGISWTSRDALLERLERQPGAAEIMQVFETVGASRPVHLTNEQEVVLHEIVQAWCNEVGARNLPPGIAELRHALKDEGPIGD
jgi:hypothetical protein